LTIRLCWDGGTQLTTLREAIQYLAKTVPVTERNHPTVQTAADHLTRSAEHNYPMFFARAATLQAIHRHRCRYAQYRGQKARLILNGVPVTGMIRPVKQDKSSSPMRWMVTVAKPRPDQ
jgi:hypothetical protein